MSSVSQTRSAAPEGSPTRFGRYVLVREIASGGMGSVYLARASGPAGFEQLVALKRIHTHMAKDPKFVRMFLDEARLAARIQHPNVCNVTDFGEIDGSYYLTMPYIFGRPLNHVIAAAAVRDDAAGAQLPVMAMRLIADACEGLHAAHELVGDDGHPLEVVHRDVSPQNLLVGYDGVVRVLDFGVASARHRLYETSTGEVKGKFAYCSPEHVAAQPVDRRADVWSLGVVLWESVTGHRLFMHDNVVSTIRAVVDMTIPRLADVRSDVPEGLQEVCDRALSRDLVGRYSTAREMGRDLLRILARLEDFVAAGEVAEWMRVIFPEGLAQAEALADETRTSDIAAIDPPRLDQTTKLDSGVSGTAVLEEGRDTPVDPMRAARPASNLRVMAWAAGVAVVAVLAIGLAGVLALASGSDSGSGEGITARELPAASPAEREADAIPPVVEAAPPAPPPPREVVVAEPPAIVALAPVPEEAPAPTLAVEAPEVEAPARPERAVPRTGPPGRLNVATVGGWGLVFFEGRQLGEAPGVFSLPPGSHTVYVQPFGRGARVAHRVTIRPGGVHRLTVPVR